jgi:hypothetical protein
MWMLVTRKKKIYSQPKVFDMIGCLTKLFVLGCCLYCTPGNAGPRDKADAPIPDELAADVQRSIDRGLSYLRAAQKSDGGWGGEYGPALAAIAAQAFAQDQEYGPSNPVVRRAVSYIQQFEQTDGGVYERNKNLANYQTSVVLMFLSSLTRRSRPASRSQADQAAHDGMSR